MKKLILILPLIILFFACKKDEYDVRDTKWKTDEFVYGDYRQYNMLSFDKSDNCTYQSFIKNENGKWYESGFKKYKYHKATKGQKIQLIIDGITLKEYIILNTTTQITKFPLPYDSFYEDGSWYNISRPERAIYKKL